MQGGSGIIASNMTPIHLNWLDTEYSNKDDNKSLNVTGKMMYNSLKSLKYCQTGTELTALSVKQTEQLHTILQLCTK